jgi:signal transduction histidine kinase
MRLVEAMGGTLWAEPRPGGGTEFGFRLPVVEEEAAAVSAPDLAVATT